MTKILFYDAKPYEKDVFCEYAKQNNLEIDYIENRLNKKTAKLAADYDAVVIFVNDEADKQVLDILHSVGIRMIALRCAGFNNVDIEYATQLGIKVTRVPSYSPYAVAEHAFALLQTLNRNIHRAFNRVREHNFSLNGLIGQDLYGKTMGVIGTGKIGQCLIHIAKGYGMKVLAYDLYPNTAFATENNFEYVDLDTIYANADVISLHAPLTNETYHMIDDNSVAKMKDGTIIVNTSRGKLIDTPALIEGLKTGKIAGAGLDVYEEEDEYFFEDHSDKVIADDQLIRLIGFNNVLITAHQAFLTKEALNNIAGTTIGSIQQFVAGEELTYQVK